MSKDCKIKLNGLPITAHFLHQRWLWIVQTATECRLPSSGCNLSLQPYISDLCFVCTQFTIPSVNGTECLNEINWLAKYWYGFCFPMQASVFNCDTIDILSEFWFLGALRAFILSLFNVFRPCDRNATWWSELISHVTKATLWFAFLNAMWLFART